MKVSGAVAMADHVEAFGLNERSNLTATEIANMPAPELKQPLLEALVDDLLERVRRIEGFLVL